MGELAALATALCFGLGALAFAAAGRRIGALAVNLLRLLIALALLTLVHLALHGELFAGSMSNRQMLALSISGVIGITLGDLCYFHCLAILGARFGALLMATAPALGTLMSFLFLGEQPTFSALIGIAATSLGVALVVMSRRGNWPSTLSGRAFTIALLAGVLGALGQAVGAMLSKVGMAADEGSPVIDPLSATQFRLAVGLVGTLVLAVPIGGLRRIRIGFKDHKALCLSALGALLGPTLGIWLSLVALALLETGVAMALMSTTPIWLLPMARLLGREPMPWLSIFGTCITVAGITALVG